MKDHKFEPIRTPNSHDAAVLIPLVENKAGESSILFEIRSRNIIQGGEICFPGGRIEPGEDSAVTVVRETCEELCVREEQVKLTAPMFTMTGVGGAYVYSWLGQLTDYSGSFSESEVGEVFALPVRELLDMKPRIVSAEYAANLPEDFPYELIPGGRNYKWRNRARNFYFYETEHGVIWGMTAELLYNVLEKFRAVLE